MLQLVKTYEILAHEIRTRRLLHRHAKSRKTTLWDGVRNYQARNFMMREMQVGDQVLFYHSNAKPPGIAGIATISKEAQPDPTCLDPKSEYFDPKSSAEVPRWYCVQVKYKKKFKTSSH